MNKILLIALLLFCIPSVNAVPLTINYQGKVEVSGTPFSNTGYFKFALVDDPNNPVTTYWSNDGTSIAGSEPSATTSINVLNGFFNVMLGNTSLDMEPMDGSEFSNDSVYLRIWFGDDPGTMQRLEPDQKITSMGFAFRAATADDALTVGGQAYSNNWETTIDNVQTAVSNDFHNLGGTDLVDDADADATNELQNLSEVLSHGNNAGAADAVNLGYVGIGTTTPDSELVVSSSNSPDVHIITTATANHQPRIHMRGARTSSGAQIAAIEFNNNETADDGNPNAQIVVEKGFGADSATLNFLTRDGTENMLTTRLKVGQTGDVTIGNPGLTCVEGSSQISSEWSGDGYIETPWIYANAIEASNERGTASTLITVGSSNYTDSDQIALVTDGETQVFVSEEGKVGIGTTDPKQLFQVGDSFTAQIVSDQNHGQSNPNNYNNEFWQSFTPSITGRLAAFSCIVSRDEEATVTASIYEGEGINGELLASENFTIENNSMTMLCEFSTFMYMHAGNKYTVHVTGMNRSVGFSSDPDSYPRGAFYPDEGDMHFRTYMRPLAPALCVTSHRTGIGTNSPVFRLQAIDHTTDFVADIQNTLNDSSEDCRGLRIKAGQDFHTGVSSDLINFRVPDDTNVGKIEQDSSYSVSYLTTSDTRLKTNIHTTRYGLANLLKLRVVDFSYIKDPAKERTGFLAQQLSEHFPWAVSPGGNDPKDDPWMIDYGRLTPLLVKAIQDQQKEIELLQVELGLRDTELETHNKTTSELMNLIHELRNRIEELEILVNQE